MPAELPRCFHVSLQLKHLGLQPNRRCCCSWLQHAATLLLPLLLLILSSTPHSVFQAVADKLAGLAEALPGVNVSQIASKQPRLLLDQSREGLVEHAQQLR